MTHGRARRRHGIEKGWAPPASGKRIPWQEVARVGVDGIRVPVIIKRQVFGLARNKKCENENDKDTEEGR